MQHAKAATVLYVKCIEALHQEGMTVLHVKRTVMLHVETVGLCVSLSVHVHRWMEGCLCT